MLRGPGVHLEPSDEYCVDPDEGSGTFEDVVGADFSRLHVRRGELLGFAGPDIDAIIWSEEPGKAFMLIRDLSASRDSLFVLIGVDSSRSRGDCRTSG